MNIFNKLKRDIRPLIFSEHHFAEFDERDRQPWSIYSVEKVASKEQLTALFQVDTEQDAVELMKMLDRHAGLSRPHRP